MTRRTRPPRRRTVGQILSDGDAHVLITGLAALVTVASTVTHNSQATGSAAVVDGYRIAFSTIASISVVAALLSLFLKEAGEAPVRPSTPAGGDGLGPWPRAGSARTRGRG